MGGGYRGAYLNMRVANGVARAHTNACAESERDGVCLRRRPGLKTQRVGSVNGRSSGLLEGLEVCVVEVGTVHTLRVCECTVMVCM